MLGLERRGDQALIVGGQYIGRMPGVVYNLLKVVASCLLC